MIFFKNKMGFTSLEALIALVVMSMIVIPIFALTSFILTRIQDNHRINQRLLIVDNFRQRARLIFSNHDEKKEITETTSLGTITYTRTVFTDLAHAENIFLETVTIKHQLSGLAHVDTHIYQSFYYVPS